MARSEPIRHTKSDPAYLPFIDNSQRQFSINGYFPEWVVADTGCAPVIMGSTMAKLCQIETDPTDIVLRTAANTTERVQGISRVAVIIVLLGQHGERMTVHCRVLVNTHETTEVMLGQEVLRVAGCDINLFDDCLYFKPYASIGLYHKAVIPFLKGDTALRAAGCTIL